ncbi:FAD-binding oxidoreductase [Thermodesulfobacteriota bacterium]
MELKSKLSEIVGSQHIDDSPAALSAFSKDHSLMTVSAMPDIIVRPDNAEQVHKIVAYANEVKIPVIPASSSVHFYGSTLPKMGGIVVELKRMNRILDIDLPDRLARIEPGVTWEQIQKELEKINHRMIMPVVPLGSSSVITSLLEREVPTNPRWEYAEPMTSTEVIWGNGMRFRTGSASVPGFPEKADSKGGNPEGPGTNWYRFFQGAEGTMGILTWAIVKFEYLPEINKTYFIAFDHLADAVEPLYRIQRQMIGNECFLVNSQVGALIFSEKWPEDYEALKSQLPPWFIVIVLSGPPRLSEEKLAYEKKALDEIAGQIPAVRRIDTALPGAVGLEKRLPGMLRKPWPAERVYWKHQLKGACQPLFFIAKMEKVPRYTELLMEVAGTHGYDVKDLGMYLQPIEQGRASHMEYQFYYDPEDETEKQLVKGLYLEAAEILFKQGAFFSRPYGLLAPMVFEHARGYTNTITKVKNVLDPNHIMCPGNVCF